MISFQPVRTGPCPGSPSQSHTKALAIFKTISTVGFASLAILQGFRRVLRQHRLPAVSTFAITVSDEIDKEELSGFTHRSATPRQISAVPGLGLHSPPGALFAVLDPNPRSSICNSLCEVPHITLIPQRRVVGDHLEHLGLERLSHGGDPAAARENPKPAC